MNWRCRVAIVLFIYDVYEYIVPDTYKNACLMIYWLMPINVLTRLLAHKVEILLSSLLHKILSKACKFNADTLTEFDRGESRLFSSFRIERSRTNALLLQTRKNYFKQVGPPETTCVLNNNILNLDIFNI